MQKHIDQGQASINKLILELGGEYSTYVIGTIQTSLQTCVVFQI